ncbi:poly(rC)-binding protein 3-like isoform X5 [Mizuhopecten yessoensis]|uniref:poly(rC)-binding protein 3-like isoform X5 n=1 Tax=Mizuhopecten yessoensis TaxID=6573 RepID=UPI000B45D02A|nr:poly(rC)-binding protein 3-like isoform X5 [Mizuhopecten yessoensis]
MATDKTMVQTDSTPTTMLTVRMIMQGKEVGSIIGKKGDNIKKFREDSGAKINISDGSCPERIVTITGSTECIHKAFTMICKKFEEVSGGPYQDLQNTPTVPKPPVTLRLVVPASQCGSLIGKGGSKIKEIRETTGASIQVASEMLPNSTERAVTVSGTADAITQCIRNICNIMLESPPKGATIQYRPKPVVPPVIFAGGQAYTVQQGQIGLQAPEFRQVPEHAESHSQITQQSQYNKLSKLHQLSLGQAIPLIPQSQTIMPVDHRMIPAMTAQGIPAMAYQRPNNTAIPNSHHQQQSHEMAIPNDLIGCIIGRGGQKINEIRQMSGAIIKISNAEDGAADRKVTITGSPETIGLAQYLINTSMEMHKNLTLDPTTSTPTSSATLTSVQSHHAPLAIPLNQLAMKPMPLLGLNIGMMDSAAAAAAANQKNFTAKMRVGVATNALRGDRMKFAPY